MLIVNLQEFYFRISMLNLFAPNLPYFQHTSRHVKVLAKLQNSGKWPYFFLEMDIYGR